MIQRIIPMLLSFFLLLTGCTYKQDLPNPSGCPPTTLEEKVPDLYQVDDLGICSAENASLPVGGRNPWDLVVVNGKLYVGWTNSYCSSIYNSCS